MHAARKFLLPQSTIAFLLAAAFAFSPVHVHAQASATADRSSEISVFGGYVFENPDYGPKALNTGATVGFNITRHLFHLPVAPSFESRATWATGNNVTERTVLAGFRGQMDFGRYHPYADFLGGGGTIIFINNRAYHEDRSTVFSYGGGVDIDLTYHFLAKLDMQGTHWNLGTVHFQPFQPTLVSVGIAYRFPFRTFNRHGDPR